MAFLYALEEIRFPVLTALMSAITYLGDELCFMAIALLFFWCINKRQAYFIFCVGLAGSIVNQFLKLWFRIPRPWVLDPEFTIVEAAREAASGYSFPSGHTQNAAGTFGAIAMSAEKKWLRSVCILIMLIVAFSRMYLGVHTPRDVAVSFLVAAVLLCILYPTFKSDTNAYKRALAAMFAVISLSALYMLFILFNEFPADIDPHNLASGTKNAYTFMGSLLGLLVAMIIDNKYINFDTKAPFIGQVLKYALGLALVIAVKSLLKAPLNVVFAGGQIANLARYFLMVVFAGCVWPLAFPFFAKIGKKK